MPKQAGYPQFSASAKKGERGVQVVSRIVNEKFGWLFKRNHQEHDFGIDGQVEIVTDDSCVTGQMFAVQIKNGESFFREEDRIGYVYRGEAKHYNYLCNYPIPVIIIICDPNSGNCYWERFDVGQARPTKEGWKLSIPKSNKFDEAKQNILAILPRLFNASSELDAYWAAHDFIIQFDCISIVIGKDEVDTMEFQHVIDFFDRLSSNKELAYHCQGKVEISIFGYDDDTRELYEIADVRIFIRTIANLLPGLFFFCRTEQPTFSLSLFAMCISNISFPKGRELIDGKIYVGFEPSALTEFVDSHFVGMNILTDFCSISHEKNK